VGVVAATAGAVAYLALRNKPKAVESIKPAVEPVVVALTWATLISWLAGGLGISAATRLTFVYGSIGLFLVGSLLVVFARKRTATATSDS